MQDRAEIERLFETLETARVAGDTDTLVACFTDDATLEVKHFQPQVTGKAAIQAALDRLIRAYPFSEFSPIDMLIEGDKVAARRNIRIEVPGGVIETEASEFVTVRDGKVVSYVQFCDPAVISQLDKS